MRHGQGGAAVEQQLQDLVIVPVGGEDQRSDIRRKSGVFIIEFLPALRPESNGKRTNESGRAAK